MPHSHGHGGHGHSHGGSGHGHSHGGGGLAEKADFWTWFGSLDEFYNSLIGTTVWIAPTANFLFNSTRQILDIASPKAFIVSGVTSLFPALGSAYCHRLLYKRFQKAPEETCSTSISPLAEDEHVANDLEEEKNVNDELKALQDELLREFENPDEEEEIEIINKKKFLAYNWQEYSMIGGDVLTHVGEGAQNVILAGNIILTAAIGNIPLGMNIGLQVLATSYGLIRSYPEARNCFNVIREFKNYELQKKLRAGTAVLDDADQLMPAEEKVIAVTPHVDVNNALPEKADAWTWFGTGDEFFDSLIGTTVWLAPGIDLFTPKDDKILNIGSPLAFMAAGITSMLAAPGAAYCHRLLFQRFQAVKNSPKVSPAAHSEASPENGAHANHSTADAEEDTQYLNFTFGECLLIGGDVFTHVGEGAQNIILGVNIIAALFIDEMSFEAKLVLFILASLYGLARSVPEARNCISVIREYKKFEHDLKVAEEPITVLEENKPAKKSGLSSWCSHFGHNHNHSHSHSRSASAASSRSTSPLPSDRSEPELQLSESFLREQRLHPGM